ncbi:RluA family pseudouridine synthase [Virgibacillus sp. 179-BFC.A HS]|uniref:RNA pseudouridylate synthase n=1 Tax=Tigheibacillus jepli TaxID=3035914 RepID=A0ABU5CMC7_9BACI|nr:RluA family pseudouridine synthase [Virgibacillus sp. 179-BFC.A HS]MDY0407051.1 RluA family pseudouridine synthase [Virgibacillus sp. 179-BFC.A HS]
MQIPTIYEDNHLLVVEKPVNIPVQADKSHDTDLLTLLKQDLKKRYNKPGNVFLGLVHRLDRPVGGVMVFAKTSKAASRLSDTIRRKKLDKEYLAVVRGTPKKSKAKLEHYVAKDQRKNIVHVVSAQHKDAKKAELAYEVISQKKGLSLVSVKLYTGRPHQIRVQFAAIGCPLYGDQKYGQQVNKPGQQIALWANKLGFDHPVKKEYMTFESTPPEVFPWK